MAVVAKGHRTNKKKKKKSTTGDEPAKLARCVLSNLA